MTGSKGKLGFGFMRLPMKDGEVDTAQLCEMVDIFMERGFNYFDTAHGYVGEKSEFALKECLTSRYSRDRYVLTDKLSTNYFDKREHIRPFFEKQLEACGVDYFDNYLMHAQNEELYGKYKECKAYETALELKKEGKIKHLGISFHDRAFVLEKILDEQPEIELVQIQLNYIDFDDPSVQSGKCYEVCEKYGKKVVVMEPVKGGTLADLPDEAKKEFDALGDASYASYAIRFAAGFPNVCTVLSGMSTISQVMDNTSYMQNFVPLSEKERKAVERVVKVFKDTDLVQCTGCKYCTEVCPMQIPIPELFALYNKKKRFNSWNTSFYHSIVTKNSTKASDCLKCGMCEDSCPQHLEIRKLLEDVEATFEKK